MCASSKDSQGGILLLFELQATLGTSKPINSIRGNFL